MLTEAHRLVAEWDWVEREFDRLFKRFNMPPVDRERRVGLIVEPEEDGYARVIVLRETDEPSANGLLRFFEGLRGTRGAPVNGWDARDLQAYLWIVLGIGIVAIALLAVL